MPNPVDILNDSYLLDQMPDGAGVHLCDETHEFIVTYREYEERIGVDEAPSVDMLLEIAQRMVAEYEEDE